MRGLLWLIAAFALAAGLSVAMHENDGHVLFLYPPWRVDLSLNLFVALLVAGFVGAYFLVRVIAHTLGLPAYVRAYRIHRRETRAREAIEQSLQALYEGRYPRATKFASRAYELGRPQALAAIVAASAAQRQREFARRDKWIEKAHSAEADWRQATLATEAEFLLGERRFDEARAVLRELQAGGARHFAMLSALLRAEQGVGNWSEVIRIAQQLERDDSMPREALEGVVINARVAMLSREGLDALGLADYLRSVPAAERRVPRIAAAAARAWMRVGDERAARGVIEYALNSEWDRDLVLQYAECGDDEAVPRIERAETWLEQRTQDAELLLSLGRLCAKRELWGKSRSYLEASLTVHRSSDAHVALAKLCERIGLADDANRHYRAAAQVSAQADGAIQSRGLRKTS
ncbi:MAG: hypothetical protein A3G25_07435 [Betaproteobacteria bacterium RIFCSPLOWO2_12_FULL_63_13]|nr:MAG: hypothetical protein A3G25_07435 [Betaproteobacteria bacterium RIFCSPLOWO2_12_FULL_63_13]